MKYLSIVNIIYLYMLSLCSSIFGPIHPSSYARPISICLSPVTYTQTKSHSNCLLALVLLSKNNLTWNFKQTRIIDNKNWVYCLIILKITDRNKGMHCIENLEHLLLGYLSLSLFLSLSLSLSLVLIINGCVFSKIRH